MTTLKEERRTIYIIDSSDTQYYISHIPEEICKTEYVCAPYYIDKSKVTIISTESEEGYWVKCDAIISDPEQFSFYAINKEYTNYLKLYKKHPSILSLTQEAYDDMEFWAADIAYAKGFMPPPNYENSMARFHRLRLVNVFCMNAIVLKIEICKQTVPFTLI